jgi:hypothetical protein
MYKNDRPLDMNHRQQYHQEQYHQDHIYIVKNTFKCIK